MDDLLPLTHFKEQFDFIPLIENKKELHDVTDIIICGMGGSALSVSLLTTLFPDLAIRLHNSYGLPAIKAKKESTLLILNSYSGNTEEVLDTLERARKENIPFCSISKGGELTRLSSDYGATYIKLPEVDLEPRFSIGYQMISILTLLNETDKIRTLRREVERLSLPKAEEQGKKLADTFTGKYPVLYASENLYSVAYLIKAAINEGAKTPSFVNIFPEANHNELQSFVTSDSKNEAGNFAFLFIASSYDHTRILKRMSVAEKLYKENAFITETITYNHTNILSVLELILTGYYMATYLAIDKKVNPYTTPLITEFKKQMFL